MIVPNREGWTIDQAGTVTVLKYRKNGRTQGFVSICLRQRHWEPGSVTIVRAPLRAIPKRYQGRGWQDRLALDAMLAIEDIYKDEK